MISRSIRPTHSLVPLLQHVVDSVAICGTLFAAQWLVSQGINEQTFIAGLVAGLIFFILGELFGVYRSYRGRTPDHEVVSAAVAWIGSFFVLAGIGFATRYGATFARSSIIGWFVLGGLTIALGRMLVRIAIEAFLARNGSRQRCAIAGLNPLGIEVARHAKSKGEYGLELVGFFDDRNRERLTNGEDLPSYRGKLDELIHLAKLGRIDTVFVTLPMRAESRIRHILRELSDTTAAVYLVPDFFVFELLHSRWSEVGGLPVVSVFETPVYGVDGILKRSADLLLAAVGLVFISPLLLMLAIGVKLSSPGPIIFRQKRYGLNGKEIFVWKFRSMRTCDNGPVVKQATQGDPRITPFGAFLRRTSLDELPQLFNVFAGTMSLVGPRPHASAHNEHYRKLIQGYMMRHKVKPGITGLAQVNGCRGETETVDKMTARIEYDHQYIRDWSLWLDIKILFKTFFVLHKQENAY